RHQDGVPLEQTGFGRRAISSEGTPYMRDTAYVAGARRFDMGERDWFISLEMASIGMEMVASWGRDAIAARLRMLTSRIAYGLRNTGMLILDERLRAPHILSLSFPQGMPAELIDKLAAEKIYVAPRLGRLRISPHVYNDEEDADRFVAMFRELVA
ncbi:MAG TPA: aminotransferase, partial [Stellaceae bacterium]|nr:aminotransferase [Stellaceae bacterium]